MSMVLQDLFLGRDYLTKLFIGFYKTVSNNKPRPIDKIKQQNITHFRKIISPVSFAKIRKNKNKC